MGLRLFRPLKTKYAQQVSHASADAVVYNNESKMKKQVLEASKTLRSIGTIAFYVFYNG